VLLAFVKGRSRTANDDVTMTATYETETANAEERKRCWLCFAGIETADAWQPQFELNFEL
jgi:hypothetical protein